MISLRLAPKLGTALFFFEKISPRMSMLIINQRKFQNKRTVKQSSGLTTVGIIADEDLESAAASSPASTRFVSNPAGSAGSDPSVESAQKNLRKIYGPLLFCPWITRSSGDAGSPVGTRRVRWVPNAACALHRVVSVFNIGIAQIWIRVLEWCYNLDYKREGIVTTIRGPAVLLGEEEADFYEDFRSYFSFRFKPYINPLFLLTKMPSKLIIWTRWYLQEVL